MSDTSVPALAFIGFIIVQRLVELAISRRNTARLLARGAREVGAAHYPLIVGLHFLWIASLLGFGFDQSISALWLALFAFLQILRLWILISLGKRWTTRIIVLDEPLVRSGPFAFLRHPNYMLVTAEIFVAPMVLGLHSIAISFTLLNAVVLFIRIRIEDAALRPLRGN